MILYEFCLNHPTDFFSSIPGVIFRRSFYSLEFSQNFFDSTQFSILISSIIPSIAFHFLWVWLSGLVSGTTVDIKSTFILLNGINDVGLLNEKYHALSDNYANIFWYNMSLWIFASLLGHICRLGIRNFKWDRKYQLFRFRNRWHYYLTGEYLDFPEIPGSSENIDFRYVDILVNTNDGSIIYTGILEDYNLSKEGGLERVYLSEVKRRYLKSDGTNEIMDGRYYSLPGKLFIIPYSQILNIHVTYYSISDYSTSDQLELFDGI